jgi:hypothetical protein
LGQTSLGSSGTSHLWKNINASKNGKPDKTVVKIPQMNYNLFKISAQFMKFNGNGFIKVNRDIFEMI